MKLDRAKRSVHFFGNDTLIREVTEIKATIEAFKNATQKESAFDDMKNSANEVVRMNFPPVQWVVQDILPVGVSMLLAKPKQGKSWLALDLTMAVAAGTNNALGCKFAPKGECIIFCA